jgi:GNAT superfamily N-acetyltransferase
MSNLIFHEVDHARWTDFEQLFECRGGPKSCWCMVWRAHGAEAKDTKGPARKQAMKARIDSGIPVGLLGYLEGTPVAWCSIAPRTSYRSLGGPVAPNEQNDDIWSLVCFFIKRELRDQGLSAKLIQAAVAHAGSRGARIVEAYPVDPGSPSYRFMGYVAMFEQAGFEHIAAVGSRRHVMRLYLG